VLEDKKSGKANLHSYQCGNKNPAQQSPLGDATLRYETHELRKPHRTLSSTLKMEQQFSPKRGYLSTKLHSVISLKTEMFIVPTSKLQILRGGIYIIGRIKATPSLKVYQKKAQFSAVQLDNRTLYHKS
jgi:hypothetical protein